MFSGTLVSVPAELAPPIQPVQPECLPAPSYSSPGRTFVHPSRLLSLGTCLLHVLGDPGSPLVEPSRGKFPSSLSSGLDFMVSLPEGTSSIPHLPSPCSPSQAVPAPPKHQGYTLSSQPLLTPTSCNCSPKHQRLPLSSQPLAYPHKPFLLPPNSGLPPVLSAAAHHQVGSR